VKTSAFSRFSVFLLAVLLPAVAAAQAPALPTAPTTNLGFEDGKPGEIPPGWFSPSFARENGYTAKIVADRPESGKQAALVALEGEGKDPQAFGNLLTYFDATSYRGKRIRFRAAVRAEVAAGNQAALWLRVDREGNAMGFFDNMADRPITSSEWKTYEISGEVAPDAKVIVLGMMLKGQGKAWIDSASFEVLGARVNADEPARPLDARGLDNLAAFTRLLGYVRFFHPSDQAAAADWEKLALAGVQAAEKPRNPAELVRALADFFHPVAPTLRIYLTGGRRPELPAGLKPSAGSQVVYWEHKGIQLNGAPNVYKSTRVHSGEPPREGQVQQTFDAGSYAGQRMVLHAAARVEAPGGAGLLKLSAYDKQDVPVVLGTVKVTSGDWAVHELAVEVPEGTLALEVDLGLAGEGRVWWDDVSLAAASSGAAAPLDNPGFETAGYVGASGWDLPWEARRAGYGVTLSEDRPKSGRRSLLIAWAKPDPASLPRPEEPLAVDLGGGVSALIPLALYQDGQGTLPHAPPPPAAATGRPEGWVPSGNDRATRLADVALAWNVFQHFYPYFDVVQADWPAELRRALSAAATDADERAFRDTLRRMVAALHDGHGGVSLASLDTSGQLPLLWEWVEDQLVVTQIAAGAGELKPGDVVLAIDGRPAREALADAEALISGATPQWRRWNAIRRLGWGKKDEPVRLEARHSDGSIFTAGLTRSLPSPGLEETRPEKLAELKPGIFYVDISRIEAADLKAALDRLAGAKGIVFDLRGYPTSASLAVISHLTGQPVSSARWNVPVITRPDGQEWQWETSSWSVQPQAPRFQAKAAFLTDGRAISFAETYMAIIENYHLAEIVGGPTAGTNGNINPFTVPGGYRLIWTGMKVLKHDGSRHHGVGVQPTLPASRTIKGVAAGRDEVLEKGIEVVSR
jgi:C-terminal processing protease CtpA/Prc